jgi:hypothetical protein
MDCIENTAGGTPAAEVIFAHHGNIISVADSFLFYILFSSSAAAVLGCGCVILCLLCLNDIPFKTIAQCL